MAENTATYVKFIWFFRWFPVRSENWLRFEDRLADSICQLTRSSGLSTRHLDLEISLLIPEDSLYLVEGVGFRHIRVFAVPSDATYISCLRHLQRLQQQQQQLGEPTTPSPLISALRLDAHLQLTLLAVGDVEDALTCVDRAANPLMKALVFSADKRAQSSMLRPLVRQLPWQSLIEGGASPSYMPNAHLKLEIPGSKASNTYSSGDLQQESRLLSTYQQPSPSFGEGLRSTVAVPHALMLSLPPYPSVVAHVQQLLRWSAVPRSSPHISFVPLHGEDIEGYHSFSVAEQSSEVTIEAAEDTAPRAPSSASELYVVVRGHCRPFVTLRARHLQQLIDYLAESRQSVPLSDWSREHLLAIQSSLLLREEEERSSTTVYLQLVTPPASRSPRPCVLAEVVSLSRGGVQNMLTFLCDVLKAQVEQVNVVAPPTQRLSATSTLLHGLLRDQQTPMSRDYAVSVQVVGEEEGEGLSQGLQVWLYGFVVGRSDALFQQAQLSVHRLLASAGLESRRGYSTGHVGALSGGFTDADLGTYRDSSSSRARTSSAVSRGSGNASEYNADLFGSTSSLHRHSLHPQATAYSAPRPPAEPQHYVSSNQSVASTVSSLTYHTSPRNFSTYPAPSVPQASSRYYNQHQPQQLSNSQASSATASYRYGQQTAQLQAQLHQAPDGRFQEFGFEEPTDTLLLGRNNTHMSASSGGMHMLSDSVNVASNKLHRGSYAFADREAGIFFFAFESYFKEYLWQTLQVQVEDSPDNATNNNNNHNANNPYSNTSTPTHALRHHNARYNNNNNSDTMSFHTAQSSISDPDYYTPSMPYAEASNANNSNANKNIVLKVHFLATSLKGVLACRAYLEQLNTTHLQRVQIFFPQVSARKYKEIFQQRSLLVAQLTQMRHQHQQQQQQQQQQGLDAQSSETSWVVDPMTTPGFVNIRIKPPMHVQGLKRMQLPADVTITLCASTLAYAPQANSSSASSPPLSPLEQLLTEGDRVHSDGTSVNASLRNAEPGSDQGSGGLQNMTSLLESTNDINNINANATSSTAQPAQLQLLTQLEAAFLSIPAEYETAVVHIPYAHPMKRPLTIKSLREELIAKHNLVALKWEEGCRANGSVGTARLWARSTAQLQSLLNEIQQAETLPHSLLSSTASTAPNSATHTSSMHRTDPSSTSTATSTATTTLPLMSLALHEEVHHEVLVILAQMRDGLYKTSNTATSNDLLGGPPENTPLDVYSIIQGSNNQNASGLFSSTSFPPSAPGASLETKAIVYLPDLTLRYVLLGPPLNQYMSFLLNRFGSSPFNLKCKYPYRDRNDPHAALLLEGDVNRVNRAASEANSLILSATKALVSVVVLVSDAQYEMLLKSDLALVKYIQGQVGVHIQLQPSTGTTASNSSSAGSHHHGSNSHYSNSNNKRYNQMHNNNANSNSARGFNTAVNNNSVLHNATTSSDADSKALIDLRFFRFRQRNFNHMLQPQQNKGLLASAYLRWTQNTFSHTSSNLVQGSEEGILIQCFAEVYGVESWMQEVQQLLRVEVAFDEAREGESEEPHRIYVEESEVEVSAAKTVAEERGEDGGDAAEKEGVNAATANQPKKKLTTFSVRVNKSTHDASFSAVAQEMAQTIVTYLHAHPLNTSSVALYLPRHCTEKNSLNAGSSAIINSEGAEESNISNLWLDALFDTLSTVSTSSTLQHLQRLVLLECNDLLGSSPTNPSASPASSTSSEGNEVAEQEGASQEASKEALSDTIAFAQSGAQYPSSIAPYAHNSLVSSLMQRVEVQQQQLLQQSWLISSQYPNHANTNSSSFNANLNHNFYSMNSAAYSPFGPSSPSFDALSAPLSSTSNAAPGSASYTLQLQSCQTPLPLSHLAACMSLALPASTASSQPQHRLGSFNQTPSSSSSSGYQVFAPASGASLQGGSGLGGAQSSSRSFVVKGLQSGVLASLDLLRAVLLSVDPHATTSAY